MNSLELKERFGVQLDPKYITKVISDSDKSKYFTNTKIPHRLIHRFLGLIGSFLLRFGRPFRKSEDMRAFNRILSYVFVYAVWETI